MFRSKNPAKNTNFMKKLFIVGTVDWFFLSHRKEIAIAAKRAGYSVTIIAKNTGKKEDIERLGLKFINLPMSRTGTNILKEMKTLTFLFYLYLNKKPTIVHHVNFKVIIIGGLAAKLAKVNAVVNAVSGLGISFSKENIETISTRFFINSLKFTNHRKKLKVIFQNLEDRSIFINNKIIKENQTVYIKGSGIDLKEFSFTPEPSTGKIVIILTARIIIEKGILEYIKAARLLEIDYRDKVKFIICGGLDENPLALKKEQLDKLCDGDYIAWLGHRTDIKQLLMDSHVVAYPSYYREGLPKSLIEAAAVGRPIITTNSVGCKDVVENGFNGFLIPVKNSSILAEKLKQLIDNKSLRIEFGKNSRLIAERDFSIENVIEKHLEIYSNLTENA